jgi:hypothetical protein
MFSINRSFRGAGRSNDVLPGWDVGLSQGQVGILITNAVDTSWTDPVKLFIRVAEGNGKGGHPYDEERRQIREGAEELLKKGCTFTVKLSSGQEIKNYSGIKKLIDLLGPNDWIGTNGQPNPRVSTICFLARTQKLVEMSRLADGFVPDDAYGNLFVEGNYKWKHVTAEFFNETLGIE